MHRLMSLALVFQLQTSYKNLQKMKEKPKHHNKTLHLKFAVNYILDEVQNNSFIGSEKILSVDIIPFDVSRNISQLVA